MKQFKIVLFDKNGNQIEGGLTIEADKVAAEAKKHYLKYCQMFVNTKTTQIEVREIQGE